MACRTGAPAVCPSHNKARVAREGMVQRLPSCSAASRHACALRPDAACARWPAEGVGTQGFVIAQWRDVRLRRGPNSGLRRATSELAGFSAVGMPMPVVQIREMPVAMRQACMAVPMRMRLAKRIVRLVLMLMMIVMAVNVQVLPGFVRMFMIMPLHGMQIDA